MISRVVGSGVVGLLLIAVAVVQDAKPATSDLVATQEGKLPIILSAPHGGKLAVPDVPERKGENILDKNPRGFVTTRDGGTEELAHHLAEAIEKRMGGKPYFVIARYHRKFIDANRAAEVAFESPKAKSHYEAYHQTLAQYCREVHKRFGRGLLLDLHGQGVTADTIYRGTQNGKTVELLRQRFGAKAHVGPESMMGLLAATGWKVFPTDDSKEHANFNGGYTVQTYGGHSLFAIDAIQLEFGSDFRKPEKSKETAEKLAGVIEQFAKLYLPEKANDE